MSQVSDTTRYLVAFSHVPGVGPARLAALIARFGDEASAWRAPPHQLREVLDRRSLESLVAVRRSLDVDRALRAIRAIGAHILTPADAAYPARLKAIGNPPFILYVKGDAALLDTRGVAIVGTRQASDYGRRAARRLAEDLATAGVTIISGLAGGIDTEAHRAALKANGPTIAVLGCGLDIAYPAGNRALMAEIARRGAVASEYPPGTPPDGGNFPARNRIVSGLSLATLVIEAGLKSGALITARYALDQGRDVFAVPGSIFEDNQRGTNDLLAKGAGVAMSAAEILTALDLSNVAVQNEVRRAVATNPIEANLLSHLGTEPVHIDALGRAAGMASADIARALTVMELKGLVHHSGGMRWVLAR